MTVINDHLAEQLFPGLDPIGKRIKIYGQPFDVVGIYVDAQSLFNSGKPRVLVLPHTTYTKVADYWKGWLMFLVDPSKALRSLKPRIRYRRDACGPGPQAGPGEQLRGGDPGQDAGHLNNITRGFFLVMLALSSVGLMVGGVGVVAIMMISVTERTREIAFARRSGPPGARSCSSSWSKRPR